MDMLKEEARKQGKPFGLLFENIEGGFTTTSRSQANAFNVMPNVVYRIYTDARPPELVRGVDLIGTPLAAFGKIVATSNKIDVFNGDLRRRERRRPGVRLVAVAAGQRSRGAEESAIAGDDCRSSPAPQPRRQNLRSRLAAAARRCLRDRCVLAPAPPCPLQESPIARAMQDELTRSMAELRLKDEPSAVLHRVRNRGRVETSCMARLGAMVRGCVETVPGAARRGARRRLRLRQLAVHQRQSGRRAAWTDCGASPRSMMTTTPCGGRLWLATDAAYKRAVNVFARKKAAFQNRASTDIAPRFLEGGPGRDGAARRSPPGRSNREWADRVRQISAVFASARRYSRVRRVAG